MTPKEGIAFVRRHGVVLESAHGPVPSIAEEIAGERIRGSWWSHAKSNEIFRVTRGIRESPDTLVCRLVDGKITYVHRRLWPALVAAAGRFPTKRLSQIVEEHTSSGKHVTRETPFPQWVSVSAAEEAEQLDERKALSALGDWAQKVVGQLEE